MFKRRNRMKFRPIGNNVVVKRLESEKKTPGGLILPDSAQKKSERGTVIAVGPGRHKRTDKGDECDERIPMSVKVGDIVLFTIYAGNDVEIDGQNVTIMPEDSILAVCD